VKTHRATICTTLLLIVTVGLTVAGLVSFAPLLLPAVVIGVIAITRAVSATHSTLLIVACMLAVLSCVGFVAIMLCWGKLEYGLIGYVIVWSPFITATGAIACYVAYFCARYLPAQGDNAGRPRRIDRGR
jgi:hypothetical protein